jgi:transposase InsO family protein
VIVDDYTRYTWLFFLVDNGDVFVTFKSFIKGIHNEFETTIKRVRSDNGSEFKNTRTDELCDNIGIRHQFSAKYTPQSNRLVERKNRTLIDMARSMLIFLGRSNQHHLLLHQPIVLSPIEREDTI